MNKPEKAAEVFKMNILAVWVQQIGLWDEPEEKFLQSLIYLHLWSYFLIC